MHRNEMSYKDHLRKQLGIDKEKLLAKTKKASKGFALKKSDYFFNGRIRK